MFCFKGPTKINCVDKSSEESQNYYCLCAYMSFFCSDHRRLSLLQIFMFCSYCESLNSRQKIVFKLFPLFIFDRKEYFDYYQAAILGKRKMLKMCFSFPTFLFSLQFGYFFLLHLSLPCYLILSCAVLVPYQFLYRYINTLRTPITKYFHLGPIRLGYPFIIDGYSVWQCGRVSKCPT